MSPRTDGLSSTTGGKTTFTVRERSQIELQEAKQRASIKWLLSKAYDHKTPEELREPFYKDHDETNPEDIDRLKPHIIHSLANAELYCMALSNLYQDPNFHNLNHWGIIQALARKGIFVAEPADCSLTETVLIQTTPLKMSAHMAVTEALMALFLKEMFTLDKIVGVTERFKKVMPLPEPEKLPADQEEALMFWLSRSCALLEKKISKELQDSSGPKFRPIKEASELSDGVSLAALLALYSPDDLSWTDIAVGDPPSMADSLYNIQRVQRFCSDILPFDVCHMTIEDLAYMHASIRQNVVCFLADLFNLLEVRPFKSALDLPGVEKKQVIEVPDPGFSKQRSTLVRGGSGPIPDLRPSLKNESTRLITSANSDLHRVKSPAVMKRQQSQEKSEKYTDDGSFVVQRGRGVPTLASVRTEQSPPSSIEKEQLNKDTKSEERGEENVKSPTSGSVFAHLKSMPSAGRPSDSLPRRSGRRSRRNSIDENVSQLSLENMGGSQDNLHLLGRNPAKEMMTHSGRKIMSQEQYIDNREREEMENSKPAGEKVSFADLRRQKARDHFHTSGINITYNDDDDDEVYRSRRSSQNPKQQGKGDDGQSNAKMTSWATSTPTKQPDGGSNQNGGESGSPDAMAAQLNSVRLKLEQRRKRIEEEKKKMEAIMSKQREKVGQQAFLRAVGAKASSNSTNNTNNVPMKKDEKEIMNSSSVMTGTKPKSETANEKTVSEKRPVSLKDMGEDLSAVQSRWLSNDRAKATASTSDLRTPDVEAMDMDTYSKNLTAMNDSLHDLQSDIQRLAQQQSQIQQLMNTSGSSNSGQSGQQNNPMDPQPFYIADQPQPQRRTWGQPQPINFAHQQDPWNRRPQPPQQPWAGGMSPQRPMMHQGNYPYGPPSSAYDPYHSPMRDAYGNPMYNGGQPFDPYGYGAPPPPSHQPPYSGGSPYGNPSQQYGHSSYFSPPSRAPFRLHEGGGASSQSPSHQPSMSIQAPQTMSPAATVNRTVFPSPLRRASQEATQTSPARIGDQQHTMVQPSVTSPRLHSSVPAPKEDDMAPQNVSFIESNDDDDLDGHSSTPTDLARKLPERLSQLNISSGSKTYRVHPHSSSDKESPSPSPTRSARPSISSTFKQSRKSSGGESGPSSLRKSEPTPEEEEALSQIKTERLKDDKDAAAGFVISFDDDHKKVKPKPMLKERRLSSRKSNLGTEFSSDGSSSSRKENVPPEDMNFGSDDGSGKGTSTSPLRRRKFSPTSYRNGDASASSPTRSNLDWGRNTSHGNNFDFPDHSSRFEPDPEVPLEPMAPIGRAGSSSHHEDEDFLSESGSDGQVKTKGLIIGDELLNTDPNTQDEMQKKKERIMMQSLRRKQQQEENRIRREEQAKLKELEEKFKEEEKMRKKEEEKARRDAILEQHKLKKEMEKMAEEGRGRMPEPVSARPVPKLRSGTAPRPTRPRPKTIHVDQDQNIGSNVMTSRGARGSTSNIAGGLPRSESRNSINDVGRSSGYGLSRMGTGKSRLMSSRPASRRGSTNYLNEEPNANLPPSGLPGRTSVGDLASRQSSLRRKSSRVSDIGDSPRMSRMDRSTRSVSQPRGKRDSSISSAYGARDFRGSRESVNSGLTYSARRGSQASVYEDQDYFYGGSMRDLSGRTTGRRKSSSASHLDFCSYLGSTSASAARQAATESRFGSLKRPSRMSKSRSFANLCGPDYLSGSGTPATPREAEGAGALGPGSLPGYRRRGEFDDGASDISSTSGFSAYGYRSSTRLFREPSAKSNRNIILNAIEYVVFPGVVNRDTRERVLDVIDRCDCPHFLLLFRDQKCQFRGLYAFYPDTEEVYKIYGTGPKQVTENMFELFFKYNSGGKKFTKIHTKHLSVTIDAFTIHNSLWLGKKTKLPAKKDMALVI